MTSRSDNANKNSGIYLIAILLLAFMAILLASSLCILGWSLASRLEAEGYLPYIQQALDEQCGEGVIKATWEGYNGDPAPSWSSSQASCYRSIDGEFVCGCN